MADPRDPNVGPLRPELRQYATPALVRPYVPSRRVPEHVQQLMVAPEPVQPEPIEGVPMQATCPNGHEQDLGELPIMDRDVRWECPTCQAVSVVEAPAPVVPDDARYLTEGDSAGSTEG